MDILSKILSMILVVLLLTMFPLQYSLGHQLALFDDYIEDEVVLFVNDIREKNYLNVEMYENFINKLSKTKVLYGIEIEHAIPKEGSELANCEELPGILVASKELQSLPAPINEKQEKDIYSLATHTHTADCYAGHRHDASCKVVSGNMSIPVNISYFISTNTQWEYYGYGYHILIECAYCNRTLYHIVYNDYSNDNGNTTNTATDYITVSYMTTLDDYYLTPTTKYDWVNRYIESSTWLEGYYYYNAGNGNSGYRKENPLWSSYLSEFKLFESYIKNLTNYPNQEAVRSWGVNYKLPFRPYLGCYYEGRGTAFVCGYTQDENPICSQVVTGIIATNPIQTVDKGGNIISTATATYLDGHTGTVSCTNNFNSSLVGTQPVTLTYNGLVGNAKTVGTRTCSSSITVKDPIPILTALTVIPSSYSVYNGTEPVYTMTAYYNNGTSKLISGYVKTGWTTGSGVKNVHFSYTENGITKSSDLMITVKPNVSSIEATPIEQTVERYENPSFIVKAVYEDGTERNVTGYIVNGFNNMVIGNQSVTLQYSEGFVSRNTIVRVTVTPMKRVCPVCGNEYYLDEHDFDQGCPVCRANILFIQAAPNNIKLNRNEPLNIMVTATFIDGHTETVAGWISNYNSSKIGSQLVMITYQGKYTYVSVILLDKKTCSICGTTYSVDEDGTDTGCPVCKDYILSISATPTIQTVQKGEELDLVVTGIYRDGHSEVVTGWSSSYVMNRTGEQQVTIYYRNKSYNIVVNVVSEDDVHCPVCGTYYNLSNNPWGCPVCAGTITGIEATLKTGGIKVPYGNALNLRVILSYQDNHKEMLFEGWRDDFDAYAMGEQTVTICYADTYGNMVSCELTVDVVDRLTEIVCENGHVYYENDSSSGCPYCAAINGNKVAQYYDCTYTEKILDLLYLDGTYYLSEGDYITVKVKLHTEGSIYSFSFLRKKEATTPVSYGGEVA